MIRRARRVTIRLTEQEFGWLFELRGFRHKWEPSEILREALKELRRQKDAADAAIASDIAGKSDKPQIAARPKKPRVRQSTR